MQKLPIAHLERNHIKAQPLEVAAFLYRQGDHVINHLLGDLRDPLHRGKPHGKGLVRGGLRLKVGHFQRHQVDGCQRIIKMNTIHQLAHICLIGGIRIVKHGKMTGCSAGLTLICIVPSTKGHNGCAVSGDIGYVGDGGIARDMVRSLEGSGAGPGGRSSGISKCDYQCGLAPADGESVYS